jgi:DNA (cytosine-5)-methyltransferase 1
MVCGQIQMTNSDPAKSAQLTLPLASKTESFARVDGTVHHQLELGSLNVEAEVTVPDADGSEDPKGAWWKAYLIGATPRLAHPTSSDLRVVDLFCGAGGLALGLGQLAREIGVRVIPELVVDLDEEATAVYAANHGARRRVVRSVTQLIDFTVRDTGTLSEFPYPPELVVDELSSQLRDVDLVLAGPPCQGHSNLNNHTRRDDPRNGLYLTVPAFAVSVGAPICVIENVPAILHDVDDVVSVATRLFESSGYRVVSGILSASAMGWPQRRRRHILVARRDRDPFPLGSVAQALAESPARTAWWAIGDLADVSTDTVMDQQTELSPENAARVSWLFENDEYDLALPERPESHRGGTSYQSVYGRMHLDQPAQTITTGFMSPGRGRYIHPTRQRVITAHEAARLQGFPDTYVFVPDPTKLPARSKLAKWIGDAVPMPLGYAAALSALGNGLPDG